MLWICTVQANRTNRHHAVMLPDDVRVSEMANSIDPVQNPLEQSDLHMH